MERFLGVADLWDIHSDDSLRGAEFAALVAVAVARAKELRVHEGSVVDSLLGQEELVIRPVGSKYALGDLLAGVTITSTERLAPASPWAARCGKCRTPPGALTQCGLPEASEGLPL